MHFWVLASTDLVSQCLQGIFPGREASPTRTHLVVICKSSSVSVILIEAAPPEVAVEVKYSYIHTINLYCPAHISHNRWAGLGYTWNHISGRPASKQHLYTNPVTVIASAWFHMW